MSFAPLRLFRTLSRLRLHYITIMYMWYIFWCICGGKAQILKIMWMHRYIAAFSLCAIGAKIGANHSAINWTVNWNMQEKMIYRRSCRQQRSALIIWSLRIFRHFYVDMGQHERKSTSDTQRKWSSWTISGYYRFLPSIPQYLWWCAYTG